jgi:hypothetical protein
VLAEKTVWVAWTWGLVGRPGPRMTDTNSPCDGICYAPGACIILGRIIANGL